MSPIIQCFLLAAFAVLVLTAAYWDAISLTIPNWIPAALVLVFLLGGLLAGLSWQAIGLHALIGGIALAAATGLFAAGLVGGGDAKLFAAVALWLGWPAAVTFLLVAALAGAVLAVLLMNLRASWARNLIPAGPAWIERLRHTGDLPYGVALATGALWAVPNTALMMSMSANA